MKQLQYGKLIDYDELGHLQRQALEAARRAMENAYNPYSDFFVGAALYGVTGMVAGSNFENASYGLTMCAERVAVFRANILGLRRFRGIAIIGRGADFDTTDVTGPCGACRQVLYEFSEIYGEEFTVVMSTTKKDKIIVSTIDELLPLAFGPNHLGIDVSRFRK